MHKQTQRRRASVRAASQAKAAPVQRGSVYFSAPRLVFNTVAYKRGLDAVRTHWPHALTIESRQTFVNVDDWRRRWPFVLASIRVLVFTTDSAGYVGRGVWQEINDAESAGVPVLLVDANTGCLHGLADCEFSATDPYDWNQHVRVTLRPSVER